MGRRETPGSNGTRPSLSQRNIRRFVSDGGLEMAILGGSRMKICRSENARGYLKKTWIGGCSTSVKSYSSYVVSIIGGPMGAERARMPDKVSQSHLLSRALLHGRRIGVSISNMCRSHSPVRVRIEGWSSKGILFTAQWSSKDARCLQSPNVARGICICKFPFVETRVKQPLVRQAISSTHALWSN